MRQKLAPCGSAGTATRKNAKRRRRDTSRLVIDLDEKGQIVGIDIRHASKILGLATLEAESLPLRV